MAPSSIKGGAPPTKVGGSHPKKFLWGFFRVAINGHPPRTEGPGLTRSNRGAKAAALKRGATFKPLTADPSSAEKHLCRDDRVVGGGVVSHGTKRCASPD